MSKRFGKKRVPNCECTGSSTCRPCLEHAPPYFFTPTPLSATVTKEIAEALKARDVK